jgi:hypothetical protein
MESVSLIEASAAAIATSHDTRKSCDGKYLSAELYVVSRESVNAALAGLCMTLWASGGGIDWPASHVICARAFFPETRP